MGIRSGASSVSDEHLIEVAKNARTMAHAPYSKFEVGAAIVAADGRVFSGCNVENSTYGLSMCAERVAIFKAVSEGAKGFERVAVVVDNDALAPPCGCCRQMIWEFGTDETEVIMANLSGDRKKFRIRELLPQAFDSTFLEPVL